MAVVFVEITGKGSRVHVAFNIKIETIDGSITEGTGQIVRIPGGCTGAESAPEELGEVFSDLCGLKVVIGRPAATNAQENLLALCLTLLDTRLNTRAASQQSTLSAIFVLEFLSAASVSYLRSQSSLS